VLMFFGALGIWNTAVAWNRRSWKVMLLGASGLILAASGILVSGGPIAERFAGGSSWSRDFRFRIWADTLSLTSDSPWCGAGLGNFQSLFPFFRVQSLTQAAVLHPESDWLWLVTEVGWILRHRGADSATERDQKQGRLLTRERDSTWLAQDCAAGWRHWAWLPA